MYKIEKNISIPAGASTTRNRSSYPFAGMEIGDSIFVPGDAKVQHNAILAARRYMKLFECVFVFGETGDGVRIWRKS